MNLFSADSRPGYRLLAALVLGMGLLLLDHRTEHGQPLRHALSYATTPVHYLAHMPEAVGDALASVFVTRAHLTAENERLNRLMLVMQQRVQRLAVLEAENARLRELLNSSAELASDVLAAEIIGIEPDPNRLEIIINKGTRDGVYVGQAVLEANGLLGQVTQVGPLSARVLLITDASHALSVQVNRSGVRAILAGTGELGRVRLLYVPDTADIEEGDLLVSSGLDQRFPRGYPVALVTQVHRDRAAPFAAVFAQPTAQMDRASHVLLVHQPQRVPDSSVGPAGAVEGPAAAESAATGQETP